jgi:hypothetical protein
MSRSAHVLSVQTLKDFKIVMCNFAEEARNSLSGVDMELRRVRDWLERDQLGYWQAQVKRRQEEVMQARADLHKRKISQQGSEAVSDAEQKEALREAQHRLRVAEEKVDLIKKKLIPYLHHEAAEYRARSQPLGDHLSGGFEKSLVALERMIVALEAYLATRVPVSGPLESGGESSGPATAAGTKTGSAVTTPADEPEASVRPEPTTAAPDGAGAQERQPTAGEPVISGRAS